ncbi:hypothetical protein [Streptomyces sp. YPW6]|uniref:hypothetical protein n=2 Tax=Streptomyces TaxID=1883 RepID=UPI003D73DFC0
MPSPLQRRHMHSGHRVSIGDPSGMESNDHSRSLTSRVSLVAGSYVYTRMVNPATVASSSS